MEFNRPQSPRLLRCRSGSTAPPLLTNVGRNLLPRSNSAAKTRQLPSAAAECLRRPPCKENKGIPCPAGVAPGGSGKKGLTPSAWALSPGRYPPASAPESAAGKSGRPAGGRRRMGGVVLGFFRQRKEEAWREEAAHVVRVMAVRLMQWRFVNARAQAAMAAAMATTQKKLFFGWLKIYELRNIIASRRILIQRRQHKLKVIKVLNPQINLLNMWELLAKRHIEAMASLAGVMQATCLPIPLLDGAQANLVTVQKHFCISMDILLAIEAGIKAFYSQAEQLKSSLCELVEVIKREVACLEELRSTNSLIYSLEMHEISLRANQIQAKEEEAESPIIYGIYSKGSWQSF
ncbi:hypothetical protein AXF42_Ash018050 [Apostasia shenzhenica]|uniref:QWRF motif-containing protein 7 n=1 Tax=Apostasia shenzhenica TaxID=1088818 RepID=A0A2I0AVL5_9ASPA|nr:hypothetical protein AXF42_Ash018050 [Apostasia shenzhenica]